MSDVPRFSEAFEGYTDLASELLKDWTPLLTAMSTKVGDNGYTPEQAAEDFAAFAKLVTQSLALVGSESLDALSILTSGFSEEIKVGDLSTGSIDASTTRTLAPKGDFVSVTGEVLPKARIKVVPDMLAPNETEFALDVDGTGLKARTYDGFVVATDEAGGTYDYPESVTVG